MWINKHPLNNSLLVFIHGLHGNPWVTWRGIPALLDTEFEADPLIRSYDVYLFEYETRMRRQPPLDPYVREELRRFLDQVSRKYATTVLVGHSQGGIVAKLFVIEKLLSGQGHTLNVDLIITLGTPHRGLRRLIPLRLIRRLPIIGRRLPLSHLAELASGSRTIRRLRDNWNENLISRVPCAPTERYRHVRSIAVVGAFDDWVSEGNAGGYPPVDIRDYMPKGHTDLARAVTDVLLAHLRGHLDPTPLMRHARGVLADPALRDGHIITHAGSVSDLVRLHRPGLTSDGLNVKTASVLMDFLYDIPLRPMRALDTQQAVVAYSERVLVNR